MTRHSLLDLVRGLGDPTWFVPGEGPTDLIEIRLMSDDFDTARDAAKSLESRYFIRKGGPPIPPPICVPCPKIEGSGGGAVSQECNKPPRIGMTISTLGGGDCVHVPVLEIDGEPVADDDSVTVDDDGGVRVCDSGGVRVAVRNFRP